jgi:hypothetical protein
LASCCWSSSYLNNVMPYFKWARDNINKQKHLWWLILLPRIEKFQCIEKQVYKKYIQWKLVILPLAYAKLIQVSAMMFSI